MDATVKIVSIHIAAAIVAALISTVFTVGLIGFTNHVFVFFFGIVILYFVGQFCQKMFEGEIEGFSAWLWDGILPFGFAWFILWTIITNYI